MTCLRNACWYLVGDPWDTSIPLEKRRINRPPKLNITAPSRYIIKVSSEIRSKKPPHKNRVNIKTVHKVEKSAGGYKTDFPILALAQPSIPSTITKTRIIYLTSINWLLSLLIRHRSKNVDRTRHTTSIAVASTRFWRELSLWINRVYIRQTSRYDRATPYRYNAFFKY